tara:strand:+ start:660 stop:893 length:234 start_codon:yes stop_codon:yes gene_type:complete
MSRIPKVEESKYNKDSKFSWVDSQWEKFMAEQKELKAINEQLRKDLETCTANYSKLWDEHKNLKKYLYLEGKGENDE